MAALRKLRPLRPLRNPEPDKKSRNRQRLAVLSLQANQAVVVPQPVPHSLIAGYAKRLERIAAKAYGIADKTVIAAVRKQLALAVQYQPDLRGDAAESDPDHPHGEVDWGDPAKMPPAKRAAYQNHNHTPAQKQQLSLPFAIDAAVAEMNTQMVAYERTIPVGELTLVQGKRIEKFALGVNTQVLEKIGLQAIEPNSAIDAMRKVWTRENAALIKSIPQEVAQRVGSQVDEMVRSGARWETIAKKLESEHGIAERRARLIARDQTSKYNGALNQAYQQEAGITHYQWFGAMDARERPTHVAMQGAIVAWDKPPPTGHPGSEINCRCVSAPVVSAAKIAKSQPVTAESLAAKVKELGPRQKDAK